MGISACMHISTELLIFLILTAGCPGSDCVSPVQSLESATWQLEKTDGIQSFLCDQPLRSISPPSSVHSVRPGDVALVSALGLSYRMEAERLLNRLSEILSMFNPSVINHQPHNSEPRGLQQQAEDLILSFSKNQAELADGQWKLVLLLVPVDEHCVCPGQAMAGVESTAQTVEDVLTTLHEKLERTLVHIVVWGGQAGTNPHQYHESCPCRADEPAGGRRLRQAMRMAALQESLGSVLKRQERFNEREDFSVILQSSPAYSDLEDTESLFSPSSRSMDQLAIQLWTNLLQPMRRQHEREGDDTGSIPCPSEESPYLRTCRNSHDQPEVRQGSGREMDQPTPLFDPVMGSELSCEDRGPSPSPPTSVHALRPADIKVVAALGDSLTAANGADAANLLEVIMEYRGLSWSIGGDETLSNVTTLPNILREFNPFLTGFAMGIGGEDTPQAFLNQAVPGANAMDMPSQVHTLIEKMKHDSCIDFQNDWKIITMFIGGNDLCDHCTDTIAFSAENVVGYIREALDILHREVPRALVNLVEVLNIVPLRRLHQDTSVGCPTWFVNIVCRCVMKPKEGTQELRSLERTTRAYQKAMRTLVDSGRYDTHDNFTVVLQPFFREVFLPTLEDGRPDRSYFAPDCFHLSQKAHAMMARALWNNMLEPLGNKTHTQDFTVGIPLQCPSQSSPFLRTYENSNYTYPGPPPPPAPIPDWGSDLSCVDTAPSDTVPTSAHRLRPGDINVVASLGDSITAGFGAKAKNLLQLRNEERGVSWSIGGDGTLETVTTLPNILKKFNPNIFGFSKGRKPRPNGFNMARSGAKAIEIPRQTRDLINALKNDSNVTFMEDWKIVTLFIGGNDLCQYCNDRASLSVKNFTNYLMESLDMLYREMPRVLVNVVETLEIEDLRKIKKDTIGCSFLQENMCPCFLLPGENSVELMEMKIFNRELQVETERLVNDGRYDGREDFAVVLQPFFRSSVIPIGMDNQPDITFFSVDCFHFSERGHAEMAIALWNNMLEPVGSKQMHNNFTHDRSKIKCPTTDHPYIFTRMNSLPSVPSTPVPTTDVPGTHLPVCCPQDSVPVWAAAVVAVTGLLIGCCVTWLLLSCRNRRNRKRVLSEVEMRGTSF